MYNFTPHLCFIPRWPCAHCPLQQYRPKCNYYLSKQPSFLYFKFFLGVRICFLYLMFVSFPCFHLLESYLFSVLSLHGDIRNWIDSISRGIEMVIVSIATFRMHNRSLDDGYFIMRVLWKFPIFKILSNPLHSIHKILFKRDIANKKIFFLMFRFYRYSPSFYFQLLKYFS